MNEPHSTGRSLVRASAAVASLVLAFALASCELLTEARGRSYAACGVYPAVPVDAHGSAGRAADYYDAVLLPESTNRPDRRELRREAPSSPFFIFFREDQSVTFLGRSHEHRYLVRVEDLWDEYWTHENELSGLESFCPFDEP